MSFGFVYILSNEVLVHSGDQGDQVFVLREKGSPIDLSNSVVTLVIKGVYSGNEYEIPCTVVLPASAGTVIFTPTENAWKAQEIEYSGHFRIRYSNGIKRRHPDNILTALKIMVSNK